MKDSVPEIFNYGSSWMSAIRFKLKRKCYDIDKEGVEPNEILNFPLLAFADP